MCVTQPFDCIFERFYELSKMQSNNAVSQQTNNIMKTSHIIGFTALFIIIVLGLSWLFTGNDFFLYRYFGPKTEQVRRDIYKRLVRK